MRILILISIFVAGCSSKQYLDGDSAPAGIRKKFDPMSAEQCRTQRGTWKSMKEKSVFPNGGYCLVKARDAGKSCASSSDCESYCEISLESTQPKCAATIPPRWDRCLPGYYERGKVLGRGECFGDDSEVQ